MPKTVDNDFKLIPTNLVLFFCWGEGVSGDQTLGLRMIGMHFTKGYASSP
jgi:hypothetical protein